MKYTGTLIEIGMHTTLDGRMVPALIVEVTIQDVRDASQYLMGEAVVALGSETDLRSTAPCEAGFDDAPLDTGARAEQDTRYAR